MDNFIIILPEILNVLKVNMVLIFFIVAGIWALHCCNFLLGYRLNVLGIYPRSWHGLIGIVFSPFLHGNFGHLFLNTIPLLLLADFVSLDGWPIFYQVSLSIILLSGFAVWLLGRRAIHIGASSLIMGYWGYLLMNVAHQGTLAAVLLALLSLYYFSGLMLNLVSFKKGTSWEGHIFGFLAGLLTAYLQDYLFSIPS